MSLQKVKDQNLCRILLQYLLQVLHSGCRRQVPPFLPIPNNLFSDPPMLLPKPGLHWKGENKASASRSGLSCCRFGRNFGAILVGNDNQSWFWCLHEWGSQWRGSFPLGGRKWHSSPISAAAGFGKSFSDNIITMAWIIFTRSVPASAATTTWKAKPFWLHLSKHQWRGCRRSFQRTWYHHLHLCLETFGG